jgi:nicotinamidase-related amidase
LFTHPVNRSDLPFTTFTGLVDCDAFHDIPINFPAHWHDPDFDGVLPKGTPVAQCLPVKRAAWASHFDTFSAEETDRMIRTRSAIGQETDVYRRRFRVQKR